MLVIQLKLEKKLLHKQGIKLVKFFDRKNLCKKVHPNKVVDYKAAAMAAELCDEATKMVKEVMVFDAISLSLRTKNG